MDLATSMLFSDLWSSKLLNPLSDNPWSGLSGKVIKVVARERDRGGCIERDNWEAPV